MLPTGALTPETYRPIGAPDGGASTETDGVTGKTGDTGTGASGSGGTTSIVPTRFQATKELTTNRVVRDVGQIYEEVISHFVTSGVPIRVSIDIESDQLNKLTEDQRSAIRESRTS